MESKDFRASEGAVVRLHMWPTRVDLGYKSEAQYETLLTACVANLRAMQELHYVANKYAILLVLQGTDVTEEDRTIRHVMCCANPQGNTVYRFKGPTTDELECDLLWRRTREFPERGRIAISNRSYYMEMLGVHMYPKIPGHDEAPDAPGRDGKVWRVRYHSINEYEERLHVNGTRVVKIFLHVSKSEQKKRLLERIDDLERNWNSRDVDMQGRAFRSDDTCAFEDCLTATNTGHAPWYIVPADDEDNAHLIVSQILLDTFNRLDTICPEASAVREEPLLGIREESTRL